MEEVKDLPWPAFQTMIREVNDYIDDGLKNNSDYSQYINKQEKTNITRSELMDLG